VRTQPRSAPVRYGGAKSNDRADRIGSRCVEKSERVLECRDDRTMW
jgi:hypothetical protein